MGGINQPQGFNQAQGASQSQGVNQSQDFNQVEGLNQAQGLNQNQSFSQGQGFNQALGANQAQGSSQAQVFDQPQGMHQFQDVNQAQVANQAQAINQALTQLERLEGNQNDGHLAKQQNQNLSDINSGTQKDADISVHGGKQGMKRRDSKKIKKKQPVKGGDHERPNTEGGHKEEDSGLEESEIDGNEQEQKDEMSSSASSCTYASSNTESSCMHTFIDDDEKFKSAKSDLGASINDSKKLQK